MAHGIKLRNMGAGAGAGANGTDGTPDAGLQFDKVDLATPNEARACRLCQRPIEGEYFEIARNIICRPCAGALSGSKRGGGSLPRGLLFGAGAAVLGTIAWFAIVKITHHEFGLLAIGIGLLVGTAVRKGAQGLGGWRTQTLAMVLTYVSITASYVPLIVRGLAESEATRSAQSTTADGQDTDSSGRSPLGNLSDPEDPKPKGGAGSLAFAVLLIFGLAFASPFLGGASNFMGILIIGIALYEAWKINRRVPLSGPFRFGSAASPPVAAAPGGGLPPVAAAPGGGLPPPAIP
ncbi:MAG TPA: hypothetical protein VIK30_09490 [Polyangia bacterium]